MSFKNWIRSEWWTEWYTAKSCTVGWISKWYLSKLVYIGKLEISRWMILFDGHDFPSWMLVESVTMRPAMDPIMAVGYFTHSIWHHFIKCESFVFDFVFEIDTTTWSGISNTHVRGFLCFFMVCEETLSSYLLYRPKKHDMILWLHSLWLQNSVFWFPLRSLTQWWWRGRCRSKHH